MSTEAKEWIIHKCNNAFTNDYEDWPGYSETLLTEAEMVKALDECARKWPTLAFRGHNVMNCGELEAHQAKYGTDKHYE